VWACVGNANRHSLLGGPEVGVSPSASLSLEAPPIGYRIPPSCKPADHGQTLHDDQGPGRARPRDRSVHRHRRLIAARDRAHGLRRFKLAICIPLRRRTELPRPNNPSVRPRAPWGRRVSLPIRCRTGSSPSNYRSGILVDFAARVGGDESAQPPGESRSVMDHRAPSIATTLCNEFARLLDRAISASGSHAGQGRRGIAEGRT